MADMARLFTARRYVSIRLDRAAQLLGLQVTYGL